jgi:hypothetical protein
MSHSRLIFLFVQFASGRLGPIEGSRSLRFSGKSPSECSVRIKSDTRPQHKVSNVSAFRYNQAGCYTPEEAGIPVQVFAATFLSCRPAMLVV